MPSPREVLVAGALLIGAGMAVGCSSDSEPIANPDGFEQIEDFNVDTSELAPTPVVVESAPTVGSSAVEAAESAEDGLPHPFEIVAEERSREVQESIDLLAAPERQETLHEALTGFGIRALDLIESGSMDSVENFTYEDSASVYATYGEFTILVNTGQNAEGGYDRDQLYGIEIYRTFDLENGTSVENQTISSPDLLGDTGGLDITAVRVISDTDGEVLSSGIINGETRLDDAEQLAASDQAAIDGLERALWSAEYALEIEVSEYLSSPERQEKLQAVIDELGPQIVEIAQSGRLGYFDFFNYDAYREDGEEEWHSRNPSTEGWGYLQHAERYGGSEHQFMVDVYRNTDGTYDLSRGIRGFRLTERSAEDSNTILRSVGFDNYEGSSGVRLVIGSPGSEENPYEPEYGLSSLEDAIAYDERAILLARELIVDLQS